MDNTIISTIEFQDHRSRHAGSIIARADKVEEELSLTELEQVGWHALVNNCDDLSEHEKDCFLEIRDLFDNIPKHKVRMQLWNRIIGRY